MDDADTSKRPARLGPGALVLVLAAFATAVLAAHFLRDGNLAAVVVLIAIIPLLGLRRSWVPRAFQLVLGLGALEWLRTLLQLRQVRQEMGQPHARMLAILGAVALITALTAALFELPRVRSWYRGRRESTLSGGNP
ncbi:MAG: hypothetical protein ACOC5I_01475 [Gemmatimonadota bacterium]